MTPLETGIFIYYALAVFFSSRSCENSVFVTVPEIICWKLWIMCAK